MSSQSRSVRVEATASGALAGHFEAMASPCEVLVDGADAATLQTLTGQVAEEVWRIERHWSRYLPGNVVDCINRADGQPVEVDEETGRFLDYAARLWDISDGLFDITSGVLRRAFHFDGSDRLPSAEAVKALLPLVGWDKVQWQSPMLQLLPGMQIDFGGIGKEYAVDRACAIAASASGLPVLVNCGGDLASSAPRADGKPWMVGIDVQGMDVDAPVIALHRGGIASSGDVHRYLMKDGVRYPHVLDPRTGWPVTGGPRVVTVAAGSCTEAGVLSTLALLHGAKAEQFLNEFAAEAKVIW
ncbi:FAD:protein FMN transferase [Nevskia ramosa]|uniref:FAD:protein FMN transferase n=1 Tax=Nevskia ramosa TaxID=64002 RepID=UPI0023521909|nr:FAD:protein FMN transferase [Nevskia ramosa]